MHRILRIIAVLLLGMTAAAYTTSADARKGKHHRILTKMQKEEVAKKRAEAEQREKEKQALKKFEEDAREYALYQECAIKTKIIQDAYLESPAAKASDPNSTDEYLFRAYLRTVKWDKECFEWKDPEAAKRVKRTLKEYVIVGVNPALREQLQKLFVALEKEECSPGVKCKPGITSAFRDDYRQKIATGFKASECKSMHGGSCRTKGWGDGRAVDVVNVSETDVFGDSRIHASEAMWKHIDKLGPKIGIYRPMPGKDPMHLQSMGWLRSLIESGKRTIEKVIEKTEKKTDETLEKVRENTKEVFKKFKKKKKCRFRKKCGK